MTFPVATREHLIVSADDYGIRRTAEPILRLVKEGKIDRVSVMARYCSEADAERLLATGTRIDIHLDLISLLRRGEHPGDGTLHRSLHFVTRYFFGFLKPHAVETEWRQQIETFRALFGRFPDGVNTHEHVHFFPRFFPLLVKLAKEYDIPYVRWSEHGVLLREHHAFIGRILATLHRQCRAAYQNSALATSTYLVSLDWILGEPHFWERLAAFSSSQKVELIVHPERAAEARFLSTLPNV